jgi:hypothetical protein
MTTTENAAHTLPTCNRPAGHAGWCTDGTTSTPPAHEVVRIGRRVMMAVSTHER